MRVTLPILRHSSRSVHDRLASFSVNLNSGSVTSRPG
uniref:Uncharacterized protein n=1 Tax=Anopheles minimus TaxID=112268 RepID=A0A182WMX1_9DIPT